MDFGSGFREEDQMSKGKLPFSYSSSSSPSSSSSQHKGNLLPLSQIYDHQNAQMGSWLGSKYDPEQEDISRFNDSGAAAKLELLDVNDEQQQGCKEESSAVVVIEKEHMFDKVVTPSDVGKLNRLVIPKQHAEKYFPLDSSTNEKGLLLNFEDRTGKAWRFRYSYWNSSQSYVMTKGWSRFVKEKKLDAGDIVSFQRGVGETGNDHLYIDWRRRPDAPDPTSHNHHHRHQQHHHFSSIPWSPLLMRPPAVPMMPRDHLHFSNPNRNAYCNGSGGGSVGSSYGYGYTSCNYGNVSANRCPSSGTMLYRRSTAPQQVGLGMVQWQQQGAGGFVEPMVYESVPVVQGKAAAKRLRLFGVNMDCPITDSEECDQLSSAISIPPHHHATMALQAHQISSPSHHSLQLNGTPLPPVPSSTKFFREGKSSMSLDLDI
ncbi:hypothetical protein P3X46_016916 [Hevea brasiliensis]|uniref:TF-B3 domain-containing protein n=1 Tax=Hevea brasiliensis TaxID=3981 RepID=A0ABQ9M0U1_HEVBR|nr:B3 domain-containing transcription factor NGA1 [Hevea brasiliensis]KAJ9173816.1 hypothetical protein P3X46_016916 [Hevea brasiliensis]